MQNMNKCSHSTSLQPQYDNHQARTSGPIEPEVAHPHQVFSHLPLVIKNTSAQKWVEADYEISRIATSGPIEPEVELPASKDFPEKHKLTVKT